MKEQIAYLGRTQECLAKEIEATVCADETMKRRVDLLVTIPGVSRELATILCAHLSMECIHPKQWIAFVGLDVTIHPYDPICAIADFATALSGAI